MHKLIPNAYHMKIQNNSLRARAARLVQHCEAWLGQRQSDLRSKSYIWKPFVTSSYHLPRNHEWSCSSRCPEIGPECRRFDPAPGRRRAVTARRPGDCGPDQIARHFLFQDQIFQIFTKHEIYSAAADGLSESSISTEDQSHCIFKRYSVDNNLIFHWILFADAAPSDAQFFSA